MKHGIKMVYLKTPDGKVYAIDESFWGSTKVDIKGLRGNLETVPGNNVPMYSYPDPEKPTIAWSVNALGMDLISQVTGQVAQGEDGLYAPSDTLPDVGFVVVTDDIGDKNKKQRVYAFPRCKATYSADNLSTDTDSKRTMIVDDLNLNALYDKKIDNTYIWGDVSDLDTVWTILGGNKPIAGAGPQATDDAASSASKVTPGDKGHAQYKSYTLI